MAKKSKVSCFSVKKSDPATRSGMIDVLQSLAPLCPVDLKGWHPPLIAPSFHVQNTMVAGDYGFWEMGKETHQHIAFCNLHSGRYRVCIPNKFQARRWPTTDLGRRTVRQGWQVLCPCFKPGTRKRCSNFVMFGKYYHMFFARVILRPSTNSSSGQTSMLHLAPQPIWKLAFSTSRQASKNHILFISMSGEQSLQTLLWLLGFDDSHCHQWTRLPPWASLRRPDHYSQRLERVHLFGCCGGDLHADQPPGQVDRRS